MGKILKVPITLFIISILLIAAVPVTSMLIQKPSQAEALSVPAQYGVIFYEPFNGNTMPSGWTNGDGSWIVNGSDNWCGTDGFAFVSTRTMNTAPPQPFNTPLESPSIDLSGVKTAVLEFNTDLKYDEKIGDLMAKVIVETDCGKYVIWCQNKESYNGKVSIDISRIAAGSQDVKLIFMFRAPPVKSCPQESWWQLDDVTIRTKDTGKLRFTSTAYSVNEDAGPAVVTVERVDGSYGPLSVTYSTSDGTAVSGKNYQSASGTLAFGDGETSKTISIGILDDGLYSAHKDFAISLANPSVCGSLGSPNRATVTVIDTDPVPVVQFSAASYTVNENDGNATIMVSRVNDADGPVSIDYAASSGTASPGQDYTSASGTLVFNKGEFSKSFKVPIIDNGLYEPDETVNLALSNAKGGASVGAPGSAVLTIQDNDPAPVVQFSATSYQVNENAGSATITVTRNNDAEGQVSVNYVTSDGTAGAGKDYTSASGTLSFNQGEFSKSFVVPVTDDGLYEPAETVNLSLSGASVGAPGSAVLTIQDNDPAPIVHFSSPAYSVDEDGGSVTITVSRVNDAEGPVSVDYATSDGTAVQGKDYGPASGTLTFNQGEFTRTFDISVIDDSLYEFDETVNLALSSVTGGYTTGTPANAVLTIHDNDPAPAIQFSSAEYSVNENDRIVTITVTRANDAQGPVTVTYATQYGTATPDEDYFATGGMLTFNQGEFTKSFDVTVIDDDVYEPAETINLELSAPTGGAVLGPQKAAILNIIDNDGIEQRSFTIELKKGWNLISFPLVNNSVWASQFAGTGISTVLSYDRISGNFNSYLVGISPSSYDINLVTDNGYFLYCEEDTSIVIYGSLPDQRSIDIHPGWNLIGWSSLSSSNAKTVCGKIDGNQTIDRYINPVESYESYLEGISPDAYSYDMVPGEGYFIYSDSNNVQKHIF